MTSDVTRPRLIPLPQAAAELGVGRSWLEKAVAAETVAVTRVGRRVFFSEKNLQEFIDSRQQPVATPPKGVRPLR